MIPVDCDHIGMDPVVAGQASMPEVPSRPSRRRRGAVHVLIELSPLVTLLLAFAVVLVLIALSGVNPIEAFGAMLDGAFGSKNSLGVTAIKTTPLMIAGLAVTIAARCGLWNIGAEGQIYLGGLFATVMVLHLVPGWPGPLQITLGITAAFAGGALWILIPALLRAYRGVAELITTLLLNLVAVNLITVLVQGPLGEVGASSPRSPTIPGGSFLPILLPGTQMHLGLVIALLLAVVAYILVWKTFLGLELRAVGAGVSAAAATGIRVRGRLLTALLLSGGLAGVAGGVEVLGLHHRLSQGFSPGYGYDAVAVALLGATHPAGVVPAALFLGALRAGAPAMERSLGVPTDLIEITQGLALIAVIGGTGLRTIMRRRLSAIGYEE